MIVFIILLVVIHHLILICIIVKYVEGREKKLSDRFLEIMKNEKERYDDRLWLIENPKVSNDYEFVKERDYYGNIFPTIYRSWKLKEICQYRHETAKER